MVPHLTRFEPLRVMAIFATYLRAGRGSEPVWFRGPKTSPKVPVIFGATSGGPNPKLTMTLEKACPPPPPPPLKLMPTVPDSSDDELVTDVSGETLIDEEETRGRNI